ncbi:MAG: condensation domain-containing protein, partial [Candidatus Tectomicrobia bacterium]
MSDLHQRIANLSLEKRALLERRLMQQGALATKVQGIPCRDTDDPCPLSFAQQRLWFLDQLDPNSPLYNITKALRLCGDLNVSVLQQTLNAIVTRHDVLRTTFTTVDGEAVQVISAPCAVPLTISDLRDCPDAQRETELQRQLTQEARRPFHLDRDIMLRAILFQLGEAEHVLLLVIHHIASDGWSMGVLMRELGAFYNTFATGAPTSLPSLPIQYADYAVWQRQWLQGETLATQQAYWRQQLDGAVPMLTLPTDRPRPAVQT